MVFQFGLQTIVVIVGHLLVDGAVLLENVVGEGNFQLEVLVHELKDLVLLGGEEDIIVLLFEALGTGVGRSNQDQPLDLLLQNAAIEESMPENDSSLPDCDDVEAPLELVGVGLGEISELFAETVGRVLDFVHVVLLVSVVHAQIATEAAFLEVGAILMDCGHENPDSAGEAEGKQKKKSPLHQLLTSFSNRLNSDS